MKIYGKCIVLGLLFNTVCVGSPTANNTFADATLAQIWGMLEIHADEIRNLKKDYLPLKKRVEVVEKNMQSNDLPLALANLKDRVASLEKAKPAFGSYDKSIVLASFKQALDENKKDQVACKDKISSITKWSYITDSDKAKLASLREELAGLKQTEMLLLTKMANL